MKLWTTRYHALPDETLPMKFYCQKTGPEFYQTSRSNYPFLVKEEEKHIEGHGGDAISELPAGEIL